MLLMSGSQCFCLSMHVWSGKEYSMPAVGHCSVRLQLVPSVPQIATSAGALAASMTLCFSSRFAQVSLTRRALPCSWPCTNSRPTSEQPPYPGPPPFPVHLHSPTTSLHSCPVNPPVSCPVNPPVNHPVSLYNRLLPSPVSHSSRGRQ